MDNEENWDDPGIEDSWNAEEDEEWSRETKNRRREGNGKGKEEEKDDEEEEEEANGFKEGDKEG